MKIKKDDNVVVISGKDRGKKGKVLKSFPVKERIIIEGINIAKRRQRPKKEGQKGQVVEVPMPIHVSNAMLLDPKKSTRTRIGKKKIKDKLVRIAKKSNTEI